MCRDYHYVYYLKNKEEFSNCDGKCSPLIAVVVLVDLIAKVAVIITYSPTILETRNLIDYTGAV